MDPNNIKALYFRSQALSKLEDFEQSVKCLEKIMTLDPQHAEAKQVLAKTKKLRQDYRDRESKKFAQMFK